jgi:ketol-acid reductoisomerase
MKPLYDGDAKPEKLRGKTIAIIGYGSQGRAHARNLRDSGCDVVAGLREGSSSRHAAAEDGIPHDSVEAATRRADIVMLLAPDEEQPAIFEKSIEANLRPGA